MKKLLALLLALCMAASLAACGGSSGGDATEAAAETEAAGGDEAAAPAEEGEEAEAPAEGGDNTVVIAVISGFSAIDPQYVYETTPTMMVNACYETLFKFDTGVDTPQPCIVDSWEFSEDGKDVTMKLKPEVKFASGNDMTSADVAFSLMRLKNLKSNPSFLMDNVESIEIVDDDTFIIHQTTADSSLLSKLTYGACSIVDSAIVKEHGGTDAEDASTADTARDYLDTTSAGSGMYIMTSYVPDEEMILEKNYNYWGEQTNVDKYIIRFEGDANTQMMGLKAGDVDIALNLNDDTMDELEGAENVTTENTPTKTISFIMMNEDPEIGGPVSNKLVQQAIRLAVDYEGMQNVCGRGAITPKSIFSELYNQILTGKIDALKLESFIQNKVNLPYNTLVMIDDSGSMSGAPFAFASFIASVCLYKNPDDDGRNMLGFFGRDTRWFSYIDKQAADTPNSLLRRAAAQSVHKPFINPTESFMENYKRINSFCQATFGSGWTDVASLVRSLKETLSQSPQLVDVFKAYPVWTIISD